MNSTSKYDNNILNFIRPELDADFSGWDFSYITGTGRMDSAPLPWSYGSMVICEIQKAESLLDMGTGGGEFLSMLPGLPETTCATEGYEPNIPIAQKKLEPLGVKVYPVGKDDILPFSDSMFNLVINKHESYLPGEVFRILKKGGEFITQQVGGTDNIDLNRIMRAPEDFGYEHWNLYYAVSELRKAGFEIMKAYEDFPLNRFYDIGAIVYYLKAIPWQIKDFTVDSYGDALIRIHHVIESEGYIEFAGHRFLIMARKG